MIHIAGIMSQGGIMKSRSKLLSSLAAVISLLASFFVSSPAVASPSLVISNPSGTYTAHVSSLLSFQIQSTDIFNLSGLKFLVSGDVDRVQVESLNSAAGVWSAVTADQSLGDGLVSLAPNLDTAAGFRIRASSQFSGVADLFAWIDSNGNGSADQGELISEPRRFSFFDSSISGVLFDGTTGDPISGERLYAYPMNGVGNWGWATSDSEGKFELRVDGIGQYQLNYDIGFSGNWGKDNGALRYLSKSEVVTIGEGPVTNFEWELTKYPVGTATVFGVVDQAVLDDNPTANLSCNAGNQHFSYHKAITSDDGAFAFLKIPNMNCWLNVYASGYLSRQFELNLTAPNAIDAKTISLQPNGTSTVSGVVTDTLTGAPVSGLMVRANYNNEGSYWGSSDTTDENGYYEIQSVPTGSVQLQVYGRNESPRYKWGVNQRLSVPAPGSQISVDLIAQPVPTGPGQISGAVLDAQGRKVAGANININALVEGEWFHTFTTSAVETGEFLLSDLPLGAYDIRISAPDSLNFRRSVTLTADAPSFVLSPQLRDLGKGTLTGKVLNRDTGLPLSNAQVSVSFTSENYDWWGYANSDSSGNYTIENVPESVVSVSAWPPQGSDPFFYFDPVKVSVKGTTNLDISLEPYPTGTRQLQISLSGIQVGETARAYLNCQFGERNVHFNQETSSGSFTFSNLPALSCSYNIQAEEYFRIGGQADLRNGNQSASRTLTPRGNSVLSGTVVSEDDANIKVAGANVHVYVESADYSWWDSTQTDANGEFTISNVPDTQVMVSVSAPQGTPRYFGSQSQPVDVDGDTSGVVVQLKPMASGPGSIEGTILSPSGSPIANAWINSYIYLSDDEWLSVSAETDEKGQYRITDLPAGTYTLNVSAQGYLYRSSRVTVGTSAAGSQITMTPEGVDTITGRVVSSSDNSVGLGDVRVTAELSDGNSNWYSNSRTAADGSFEIKKVPRGGVTLSFRETTQGYFRIDSKEYSVAGDLEVLIEADPHPVGTSSFTAVVTEWSPTGAEGLPIDGANVDLMCYHSRGFVAKQANTNSEGRAVFEGVAWPDGECETYASKEGFSSDGTFIRSPFPSSKTFELIEDGSDTITATLLDPEGQPVVGSYLNLEWRNGHRSRSWYERTDDDGVGAFENVAKLEHGGTYTLSAETWDFSSEDWITVPAPFEFENEGSAEFDIQLGRLEPGPVSITGRFLDSDSLGPLANTRVQTSFWMEIEGVQTQNFSVGVDVASDGSFTLDGLYPGKYYELYAYSMNEEFNDVRRGVWVPDGQTLRTVDIYAEVSDQSVEGFGLVSGYMVDENGDGVEGIAVNIYSRSSGRSWDSQVSSSEDGYFEFSEVPFGDVLIWIESPTGANGREIYRADSFGSTQFTLDETRSSRTGFEFQLVRYPVGTGSITGRVVDELTQQNPDVAFAVSITGDASIFPSWSYASVNPDGTWMIDSLPDGEYTVTAESRDGSSDRVALFPGPISVRIENGQAVNTGIQSVSWLEDGGTTFRFTVVDADTKEPLPDVQTWIAYESAGQYSRSQEADSNGTATYAGIPEGRYRVAASAEGYAPPVKATVVDVSGAEKSFRYEMRPLNATGTITGTVKDRFGNAIPDASVWASWEITIGFEGGTEGVFGYADQDGNFTVRNVPLWPNLILEVYARDSGRLEKFASYRQEFDLSAEVPTANFDVLLFEPSVIKGRVLRPEATTSVQLQAIAIDSETGMELAWADVSEDGLYQFENVPSVPLRVQIRTYSRTATRTIATSYYKQTSSVTATGVALAESADVITPAPGQTYELEPMQLSVGNSITGLVRFRAGDQVSAVLPRPVMVEVFAWNGSDWILRDDLGWNVTSNYEGGRYTIPGLPDGRYKLRFQEAYETNNPLTTTFLGGATSLEEATEVVLSGGQRGEVVPAVMSIPQPTFSVAPVSVASLTTTQRAALSNFVAPTATSSTSVELNLGVEMAGEWVAISLEDASLSSSAFSAASFTAQSVTWYQVDAAGKLTIPVTSTGTKNVVVQNSQGQPIGWTTVTIASSPTPPAGGGGGGGGFFGPIIATPVSPITTNPIPVGQKLGAVDSDGNAIDITPALAQDKKSIELLFGTAKLSLAAPAGASFSEDGKLSIAPASSMTISATGYEPDSTVSGFLVPTASLVASAFKIASEATIELGTTTVSQDGSFDFDTKFDAEPGSYLLQLTGTTADGKQTTIALETLVAGDQTMKTWAKRLPGNLEAKLYAKNIVGAGKVQFYLNGKEIAWIRAVDETDPKLRVITEGPMTGANYLVRTVKLNPGKNALEVYIDGVRTTRVAYSRK